MPQLDSDNFTYSNGALATVSSAKWTKLSSWGDMTVASNAITGNDLDSFDVITSWSGSTTDQYSQATAGGTLTGDEGGLSVRSDAANTFYLAQPKATTYKIYKCVGGSFTELGTITLTPASGDVVYLEMQSTTLILKIGGVTKITVTSESSIASGKPGIGGFAASATWDAWVAGDFSAGGRTTKNSRAMPLGTQAGMTLRMSA